MANVRALLEATTAMNYAASKTMDAIQVALQVVEREMRDLREKQVRVMRVQKHARKEWSTCVDELYEAIGKCEDSLNETF